MLPSATALLLCGLEDVVCPWPETRPAKEILEKLREPLPARDEGRDGKNRSLYQLLFGVVRRRVQEATGCDAATFRLKADAVGLIDADDEDDAFDRYVEGHVRTFVEIGAINAARLYIQDLLRTSQVDMADLEHSTGDENRFSPQDYHELGRWSDHLKARLKLGLVDRSRGTSFRFHHERAIWRFPSKLPRNVSPERLAWYLVQAARRARASKVQGRDAVRY